MSAPHTYTRLERLLHHIAFRSVFIQKMLADMEDQFYSARLESVAVERPVFITSLPRAGTTLLLELLASLPEFATHTYRHMPFIMVPMMWSKLSHGFRLSASMHERAHGDGMEIGFDSAEAFEEILWMAFWGKKYGADRIQLWDAEDRDEEFEDFLRSNMRKVAALHTPRQSPAAGCRYMSKNNANISRLRLLPALFPDSQIVIPVREPHGHVQSLQRQHRRFTNLHANDEFGRRYMADIGHLEFGANLRPFNFGNWLDQDPAIDADEPEFWWRYWIAAMSYILDTAGPGVILVDYDRLCTDPEPSLSNLGQTLGLAMPADLLSQADRIRRPTRYAEDNRRGELQDQAHELYERAIGRTIQSIS